MNDSGVLIQCAFVPHNGVPAVSASMHKSVPVVVKEKLTRVMRKPVMWFPIRYDTNRAVQVQKKSRSWRVWIKKVEDLYKPCSENKGADQLRSHFEVY